MLRALLLSAALCFAAAAAAQLRTIPADAKRARLSHVQEAIVELNGKQARLAPGAQIRDTENRMILPMAIPPGALVKFVVDAQGEIRRVWILSAAEAAQTDPK